MASAHVRVDPVNQKTSGWHTPAAPPSYLSRRTSLLQRKCACGGSAGFSGKCSECDHGQRFGLQRRHAHSMEPEQVPPIVHEVLHSLGAPLVEATRTFMEPRLSHDFSRVRI